MEPIKFTVAAKRFFGLKPGETLQEFAREIHALTNTDKDELAALLSVELGVPVER